MWEPWIVEFHDWSHWMMLWNYAQVILPREHWFIVWREIVSVHSFFVESTCLDSASDIHLDLCAILWARSISDVFEFLLCFFHEFFLRLEEVWRSPILNLVESNTFISRSWSDLSQLISNLLTLEIHLRQIQHIAYTPRIHESREMTQKNIFSQEPQILNHPNQAFLSRIQPLLQNSVIVLHLFNSDMLNLLRKPSLFHSQTRALFSCISEINSWVQNGLLFPSDDILDFLSDGRDSNLLLCSIDHPLDVLHFLFAFFDLCDLILARSYFLEN